MKTTVIHHSADYDGIFCREIARKFLTSDTEFIGWDFTDKPLAIPPEGTIYILDLPVDRVFDVSKENGQSLRFAPELPRRIIWIDHHKSSIASHPTDIPGYRIDGVAACRLAWQWFTHPQNPTPRRDAQGNALLPSKEEFIGRKVSEPLAVRLAGEYDVWDHAKSNCDDIIFQFGLDSVQLTESLWADLLTTGGRGRDGTVEHLLNQGRAAQCCYAKRDADIMRSRSFKVQWEGLTFLALNTARCNSNTFAALDNTETGHDALLGFFYNGKRWTISLYHANHRTDLDLSLIAVKHGGGGHRGACGFITDSLPF